MHQDTLETLFHALERHGVILENVILKASMGVSGKGHPKQAGVQEVAERTLRVLKRTVPAALPGVVFLSGGQTDEHATAHLDAMNRIGGAPWPLTFSYSRALQAVPLKTWRGVGGQRARGAEGAPPPRPHEQPRREGPVERRSGEAGRDRVRTLYESSIASLPLVGRGKVRDIYGVGDDRLLIVTTDRLSAYDVILPTPIPEKGRVLTELANFWFGRLAYIIPNHLTGIDPETVVQPGEREQVRGRSIVVRSFTPLPIEAVVRGYLEGSGWKEYQESGTVCGIALPPGLARAATPAAADLHARHQGRGRAPRREHLLRAHRRDDRRGARARRCATPRSASTRPPPTTRSSAASSSPTPSSSSALDAQDRLYLIDEALTPDSSRFWPLDTWREGASPESFDKQYVRNWLDSIGFERKPPAPAMPPEVARRTSEKYLEALKRLTG